MLNSLPDTWSHPDLIKLSLTDVAEELRHNHDFLWKAYGIDARPYFRPPYGQHNAHVDKISGELGYTADTQWPGAIVIGHLNHMPVTHVYGQLATSSARANFAPSRSTTCSSSPRPTTRPHLSLLPQ